MTNKTMHPCGTRVAALLLALTMGASGAWAQGRGPGDVGSGPGASQSHSNGRQADPRQNGPSAQAQPGRGGPGSSFAGHGGNNRPQQQASGPGQRPGGPQFQQGHRLPTAYSGRQYRVENWREHGLRQPPRGQRWVQVGGQYMLVAIATGVIASILLSH